MAMKRRYQILIALAQLGEAYIHPRRYWQGRHRRKAYQRIARMSPEQFDEYARASGLAAHLVDILRLQRRWYPTPDDFDRMTPEQFHGYVRDIGFDARIKAALAEPLPEIEG